MLGLVGLGLYQRLLLRSKGLQSNVFAGGGGGGGQNEISLVPIPFGKEWSGSEIRMRLSGELKEANYDGIHSTY